MIPAAIKQLILPSDEVFYTLFNKGAALVVKMSDCLNEILNEIDFSEDKWSSALLEMKSLYEDSQQNYRHSVKRLSRVFITPIDRESVHQLAVDLHAVARTIYLVPRSLTRHKEHLPDEYAKYLGHLLIKSASELEKMVQDIGTTKRIFVMHHAKEIFAVKREMEITYDRALQNLYQENFSPAQFIRKLEAYNSIKEVGNLCRNTANTAEGIVLTHVG